MLAGIFNLALLIPLGAWKQEIGAAIAVVVCEAFVSGAMIATLVARKVRGGTTEWIA